MSVIEDSRKVLQDFIAPELRAIAVRLDALEKRFEVADKKAEDRFAATDRKIDNQFNTLDKKIDDVDKRAEKRHDELRSDLAAAEKRSEKRQDELLSAIRQNIDFNAIEQRVAKLESERAAHQ